MMIHDYVWKMIIKDVSQPERLLDFCTLQNVVILWILKFQ